MSKNVKKGQIFLKSKVYLKTNFGINSMRLYKACESQFLVYRHFFFQSWWGDFFIIHLSLFHQISLLTNACHIGSGVCFRGACRPVSLTTNLSYHFQLENIRIYWSFLYNGIVGGEYKLYGTNWICGWMPGFDLFFTHINFFNVSLAEIKLPLFFATPCNK